MKKIVADTSFCGAWIFQDEATGVAEELLEELITGSAQLIVPSLWHYEMANMLRSGYRRKRLNKTSLGAAEKALSLVPVHEVDVPRQGDLRKLIEVANRYDLSVYDAAYLELSNRLKVPLMTTDKKLKSVYKSLIK